MSICTDNINFIGSGRAIVVTDSENCLSELIQPPGSGQTYPAIPVAMNSGRVELRSGSVNDPIQLPYLQEQGGGGFTKIVTHDSTGSLAAFESFNYCIDLKLVIRNGQFEFVEDTLPEIFDSNICTTNSLEQIEYILGAKEINTVCSGVERTFYQVFLIPKDMIVVQPSCFTCD